MTVTRALSTWEQVIAYAVAGTALLSTNEQSLFNALLVASGDTLSPVSLENANTKLDVDGAYVRVDQSKKCYVEELCGHVPPLVLPDLLPAPPSIVLAPFGHRADLMYSTELWRFISNLLRTYDPGGKARSHRVQLVGDTGQRLDTSNFAENDILSNLPEAFKLSYIRNAALVVGVPNAWTWLAAGWKRPMVLLYPEQLPYQRWFPSAWEYDDLRRLHCVSPSPQLVPVLAALRKLINAL